MEEKVMPKKNATTPSLPLILSIGELLWDITPWGKQPGGAPANFAFQAGKLGAESYIISAVGNDADGRNIVGRLKRAKINPVIDKTNASTGIAWIELKDEKPIYKITGNVAWDYIALNEQKKELASKADVFYFNTLAQRSEVSRNTIVSLLKSVQSNAFRVFDMNLHQQFFSKEIIEESLILCNVVKLDVDVLPWLKKQFDLPDLSPLEMARWIRERYYLKFVILFSITESIVFGPLSHSSIQIPQDGIVSTVGGGSAFLAAFITGILKGEVASQAHQQAVNQTVYVNRCKKAWV